MKKIILVIFAFAFANIVNAQMPKVLNEQAGDSITKVIIQNCFPETYVKKKKLYSTHRSTKNVTKPVVAIETKKVEEPKQAEKEIRHNFPGPKVGSEYADTTHRIVLSRGSGPDQTPIHISSVDTNTKMVNILDSTQLDYVDRAIKSMQIKNGEYIAVSVCEIRYFMEIETADNNAWKYYLVLEAPPKSSIIYRKW